MQERLDSAGRVHHVRFNEASVGSCCSWIGHGIGGPEKQNSNGPKAKNLIGVPSGHRTELVVGSLPNTWTISAGFVMTWSLHGQQSENLW